MKILHWYETKDKTVNRESGKGKNHQERHYGKGAFKKIWTGENPLKLKEDVAVSSR